MEMQENSFWKKEGLQWVFLSASSLERLAKQDPFPFKFYQQPLVFKMTISLWNWLVLLPEPIYSLPTPVTLVFETLQIQASVQPADVKAHTFWHL